MRSIGRMGGMCCGLCAALIGVFASSAVAEPKHIGDGERIVFYGDKTVLPPEFGFMVESFVRVRYPDSKARFWHMGTRRFEKIEVANERFDEYLAPLRPTVVVLSWGLGDGELKAPNPVRVAAVRREYEKLIGRCKELGATVYALTPPRPTVAKKNLLAVNRYDETIEQIAEAMRAEATARGATVLDWYAKTAELHELGTVSELTDKDGMYPSPLSSSYAAKLIMDAWGFEPMEASVEVDWSGQSASASHGSAEVVPASDSKMALVLHDFPMPLYTGKRSSTFRPEFAISDYCRMMLTIDNVPDGTVTLSAPNARRQGPAIPVAKLREGVNLAFNSPLARAAELKSLIERIEEKNQMIYGIVDARQRMEAHPPEPELLESYRTNILSREQYLEGIMKVIQRTPRTMNVSMHLTHGR